MPIRQRIENAPGSQHADLKLRLVEEWTNPQEVEGNPVIIEEQSATAWLPQGATPGSEPVRLYVVWDSWAGMDQLERSSIILDAYEVTHGAGAAANVTLALGLTTDEATRLGIDY